MAEKTSKLLTCQNRKKGNFITLSTGCLFEMCLCLEVSFCLFILFMLLNCGAGDDSWEFLDCKEIQLVHPKGNQSWIFIGRTDAEAPILWPPDAKNWIIEDLDAAKAWGQEEKGMTGDEVVGWFHWLDGHEFWASSGSWWRTGKPGVLQSMGLQKVGHDWATELLAVSTPINFLNYKMKGEVLNWFIQ